MKLEFRKNPHRVEHTNVENFGAKNGILVNLQRFEDQQFLDTMTSHHVEEVEDMMLTKLTKFREYLNQLLYVLEIVE